MDEIDKLYEVVTREGLYTKSIDEFKTKYSDTNNRQKLFDVVSREGLYTKTIDDFNSKYFNESTLVKKKNTTSITQDTSLVSEQSTGSLVGGAENPFQIKSKQVDLLPDVNKMPAILSREQQLRKELSKIKVTPVNMDDVTNKTKELDSIIRQNKINEVERIKALDKPYIDRINAIDPNEINQRLKDAIDTNQLKDSFERGRQNLFNIAGGILNIFPKGIKALSGGNINLPEYTPYDLKNHEFDNVQKEQNKYVKDLKEKDPTYNPTPQELKEDLYARKKNEIIEKQKNETVAEILSEKVGISGVYDKEDYEQIQRLKIPTIQAMTTTSNEVKGITARIQMLDQQAKPLKDLVEHDRNYIQSGKATPEEVDNWNAKNNELVNIYGQYKGLLSNLEKADKSNQNANDSFTTWSLNHSPLFKLFADANAMGASTIGGLQFIVGKSIQKANTLLGGDKLINPVLESGSEFLKYSDKVSRSVPQLTVDDIVSDPLQYTAQVITGLIPYLLSDGAVGLTTNIARNTAIKNATFMAGAAGKEAYALDQEMQNNPEIDYSNLQYGGALLGAMTSEGIMLKAIKGLSPTMNAISKEPVAKKVFENSIKSIVQKGLTVAQKAIYAGNKTAMDGAAIATVNVFKDNYILGKETDFKETVWEHIKDFYVLGKGMHIFHGTTKAVSDYKSNKATKDNYKKINEFTEQLKKPNLTDVDRTALQESITTKISENEKILLKTQAKVANMTVGQFEKLMRIDQSQFGIKLKVNEIRQGNLPKETQAELIAEQKRQWSENEKLRADIHNNPNNALDQLSKPEQERLMQDAEENIQNTQNPNRDKILKTTPEEIKAKAIDIHKLEESFSGMNIKEIESLKKTAIAELVVETTEKQKQDGFKITNADVAKRAIKNYNEKIKLENEKAEIISNETEPQTEVQEQAVKEKAEVDLQVVEQTTPDTKEQSIVVAPSVSDAEKTIFNDKETAISEIKSKNLTRVQGLKMGLNQAVGTYISTEAENRYATPEQKSRKMEVSIENPLVTNDSGLIEMRSKVLQETKEQFTAEDFEMYEVLKSEKITIDDLNDTGIKKLARITTEKLKEQGYDSVYTPETAIQEGELVVFDRAKSKYIDEFENNNVDLPNEKENTLTDKQLKHNAIADLQKQFNGLNARSKKGAEGNELRVKISSLSAELGYKVAESKNKITVLTNKGKKLVTLSVKEIIAPAEKVDIDYALKEINRGVTGYGANTGNGMRVDLGLPSTEVSQGSRDVLAGKIETAPAKRLIQAFKDNKAKGGYEFKQGSGNQIAKDFVSFEDVERFNNEHNLTDAERDFGIQNEAKIVKEYEDYFNNLNEKEQLEILQQYENRENNSREIQGNTKPSESGNDVANEKIEKPDSQEKRGEKQSENVKEKIVFELPDVNVLGDLKIAEIGNGVTAKTKVIETGDGEKAFEVSFERDGKVIEDGRGDTEHEFSIEEVNDIPKFLDQKAKGFELAKNKKETKRPDVKIESETIVLKETKVTFTMFGEKISGTQTADGTIIDNKGYKYNPKMVENLVEVKSDKEVINPIAESKPETEPATKSPELAEVEKQIETAKENVRISKERLDRKAKSLDKEILADQENLFGERKNDAEPKLFDERVDIAEREKATATERQQVKDAENELKSLQETKVKIESGEIKETGNVNDAAIEVKPKLSTSLDRILDTAEVDVLLDFLDKFKIDSKGVKISVLPVPEIWNAFIDTVKLSVKSGNTIANAIKEARKILKDKYGKDELDNVETVFKETISNGSESEITKEQLQQQKDKLEVRIKELRTAKNEQRNAELKEVKAQFRDIISAIKIEKNTVRKEQLQQQKDKLNTVRKEVAKSIDDFVKQGKLAVKQGATLVKRALNTDFTNPISTSNFQEYAEKVFDNANYKNDVAIGKNAKSKIRAGLKSKSVTNSVVQKTVIADFLKLDPSKVSNILEYNEIANKILGNVQGAKTIGLQEVLPPRVPGVEVKEVRNEKFQITNEEISKYTEQEAKLINDKNLAKFEQQYKDFIDKNVIDPSKMSLDEMKEIIKALDDVDPSRKIDELIEATTVEKNQAKADAIAEIAKAKQETIQDLLDDNKILVNNGNGAKIGSSLSKLEIETAKALQELDLSDLDLKTILEVNHVLDNILTNGDFSNSGKIKVLAEQKKKAENLVVEINKSGFKIQDIGNLADEVRSNEMLNKKLAQGSDELASIIQSNLGIRPLFNAHAEARITYDGILKAYEKITTRLSKVKGKNIYSNENVYRRGVLAKIMQHLGGTPKEKLAEFNRLKEEIKITYERLLAHEEIKRNDTEELKKKIEEGNVLKQVYGELLESSNNITDVIKKSQAIEKGNLELVKFWQKEFSNISDAFFEHSILFDNVQEVRYVNYTATKSIGDKFKIFEREDKDPFQTSVFGQKVNTKLTGSQQKRNNLRSDAILDLNFDKVQSDAMYQMLYKMKSSEAIETIKLSLKDKKVIDALQGKDNVDFIEKQIVKTVAMQRGESPLKTVFEKQLAKTSNRVSQITARIPLGSFAQPLKQYPSVAINSAIMLGNNADLLVHAMTRIPSNIDAFYNKSSIGLRGMQEAGTSKSFEVNTADGAKFQNSVKDAIDGAGKVAQKTSDAIMWSLVTSDTKIAKHTYLAFYMESLLKQGMSKADVMKIDWSTEHKRFNEKASSYAEQKVSVLQTTNDPTARGKAFESNVTAKVLSNILLPYSSFATNQRFRMHEDAKSLTRNPKDGKAWQSLTATIVEQALFNGIKIGIAALGTGVANKALRGLGYDDEDDKIVDDKKEKKFYANTTSDIFFSGIGSLPSEGIKDLIDASLESQKQDKFFNTFDATKYGSPAIIKYSGSYGVLGQYGFDLYKDSDLIDGKVDAMTKGGFGKKKWEFEEKELTDREKTVSRITTGIDAMKIFVSDAELSQINNKIKRSFKKNIEQKYGVGVKADLGIKGKTDQELEQAELLKPLKELKETDNYLRLTELAEMPKRNASQRMEMKNLQKSIAREQKKIGQEIAQKRRLENMKK